MNDWLAISKNNFQEQIIDFLWRDWSTIGIAGVTKSKTNKIIDPEALLLFSLNICRYEPRLFDEIIDWLYKNGQFINVQRLQKIQNSYEFHSGPQLSAIAELLSKKPGYKLKWSGLAKKYYQNKKEPLFFDKNGDALPSPPENLANPEFLNHGFRRGQIKLRGYSQSFDIESPACLLLRLRALLGVNARAEILCLLTSEEEIHPSGIARITGYSQKTIQTTLVEMAHSGVILTRTSKVGKFYSLKSGIFDALLKPAGEFPKWVNWPPLLKGVEIIWEKLNELSGQEIDSLLLFSELKNLVQSTLKYWHPVIKGALAEPFSPDHLERDFQNFLNKIFSFFKES